MDDLNYNTNQVVGGKDVESSAAASAAGHYPLTNRGVTQKTNANVALFNTDILAPDGWEFIAPKAAGELRSGIHWLSLTLFCSKAETLKVYEDVFKSTFGDIEDVGYGVVGYRSVMSNDTGFKLAYEPSLKGREYSSFFIPGSACDIMPPELVGKVYKVCEDRGIRIHCTRVDMYADLAGFSVYQFKWMIDYRLLRKAFQCCTMTYNDMDDDVGNKGTATVYCGSQFSDRLICCYDKRGYTRVELRIKQSWAEAFVQWLRRVDVKDWTYIYLTHLQDFIEIDYQLWADFVGDVPRAMQVLGEKKDAELEAMKAWFLKACSQVYSNLVDTVDKRFFDYVLKVGREGRKHNSRHAAFLHKYGLGEVTEKKGGSP